MFIGRKDELMFFDEKYLSNKAELIILYGRRRIGKTALIQEFIKDKPHIFYSAVQITDNVQLTKMSNIIKHFYKKDIYSDRFSDWEALFRFISDHLNEKEKLVLVMDEFPYMVQGNNSIPSILQKLWDLNFSRQNLMIIICGSSMSFMEKEILNEKNPLYGRTTGIVKMREMSFESARGFMGKGNLVEHLNYYSIFSGVPYYLSMIDPMDSFENNLKKNILSNNSVLFNEVEFLLKQELREVNQYNAIIESVALGDTRINDIFQKTGIEKSKLPFYIKNLIDLGIIRKEYPVTISTKEQGKTRSGIYKIDNGYFKFYYAYVYPYISELLEGGANVIFEEVILKQLPMFVSSEFERIAVDKIRELGKNKLIPIRPIKVGRWWKKDKEIDIVAFDLNNNYIFGECKWRNEKVGMKVLEQLKIKDSNFEIPVNNSSYVLFSKSGFTDELIKYARMNKDIMLFDYAGDEPQVIQMED